LRGVFEAAGKVFLSGFAPMAATVLMVRHRRGDPMVAFVALYAGLSVVFGVILSGGAGVDSNALFDADIAMAMATGLVLRHARARPRLAATFAWSAFTPLAIGLMVAVRSTWLTPSYWVTPLQTERALAHKDISFLAKAGNPGLCEMLSLCYWAGLRESVDVFNLSQAFEAGRRDENELIALIDAHYFRALQILSLSNLPFSPRVRAALIRAYRVDHQDANGVFLLPRK
jgi:hypothetical protein